MFHCLALIAEALPRAPVAALGRAAPRTRRLGMRLLCSRRLQAAVAAWLVLGCLLWAGLVSAWVRAGSDDTGLQAICRTQGSSTSDGPRWGAPGAGLQHLKHCALCLLPVLGGSAPLHLAGPPSPAPQARLVEGATASVPASTLPSYRAPRGPPVGV